MAKKPKQITAHTIVMGWLRQGYTYRQMSEHTGLTPPALYKMANNPDHPATPKTMEALSVPIPPDVVPHWIKRVSG